MNAVVLDGALQANGMPKFPNLTKDDVHALQHFIRNKARLSGEKKAAMVE